MVGVVSRDGSNERTLVTNYQSHVDTTGWKKRWVNVRRLHSYQHNYNREEESSLSVCLSIVGDAWTMGNGKRTMTMSTDCCCCCWWCWYCCCYGCWWCNCWCDDWWCVDCFGNNIVVVVVVVVVVVHMRWLNNPSGIWIMLSLLWCDMINAILVDHHHLHHNCRPRLEKAKERDRLSFTTWRIPTSTR